MMRRVTSAGNSFILKPLKDQEVTALLANVIAQAIGVNVPKMRRATDEEFAAIKAYDNTVSKKNEQDAEKEKKPYTPLNDENMAGHFPVLFEDIEAQNLDDYLASKSSWTPNKDQKLQLAKIYLLDLIIGNEDRFAFGIPAGPNWKNFMIKADGTIVAIDNDFLPNGDGTSRLDRPRYGLNSIKGLQDEFTTEVGRLKKGLLSKLPKPGHEPSKKVIVQALADLKAVDLDGLLASYPVVGNLEVYIKNARKHVQHLGGLT